MSDSWLYIPLLEADGKLQMSIDSYLLEQFESQHLPSILRFYTWSPVAISLGCHQYQYPEHWQQISYQGVTVDIVKRPTGGRAVLHQGDLCYSLITSNTPGSFRQGYMKICQFLLEGWRSLGVDLSYGEDTKSYAHNTACFSSSSSADLLDHMGIKRIGNAQLRRKKATLQQGSISLYSDRDLYHSVFQQEAPPALNIPIEKLIEHLVSAAEICFQTQLVKQSLQDEQWEKILRRNDDKLHIVNS